MTCKVCKQGGLAGCLCSRCGSVYVGPPDLSFYNDANAYQHELEFNTELGRRINSFRFGLLMACVPYGNTIADFGSSVGGFLSYAQRNYTVYGVEINPLARRYSITRCPTVAVFPDLDCLPPYISVDAWTVFDVLEHVAEPRDLMKRLSLRLRPGGRILLTTPNAGCQQATSAPAAWHHFKPREHVWLFSSRGVCCVFESAGLKVIASLTIESLLRPNGGENGLLTVIAEKP